MNISDTSTDSEKFYEIFSNAIEVRLGMEKAFRDSGFFERMIEYQRQWAEVSERVAEALAPIIQARIEMEKVLKPIISQWVNQIDCASKSARQVLLQVSDAVKHDIAQAEASSSECLKQIEDAINIEYIPAQNSELEIEDKCYEMQFEEETLELTHSDAGLMIRQYFDNPAENHFN